VSVARALLENFAERGVMELRANVWKPRLHPVAREGEREGAT
jgi:hypothetical protein